MKLLRFGPAIRFLVLFLSGVLFPGGRGMAEEPLHPGDIEFRRQAVRRFVFDPEQAIPLASLRPATLRDFDLMHPELGQDEDARSPVDWKVDRGRLVGTSGDQPARSLRWVGGFNPFATYDLAVNRCTAAGSAFRDSSNGNGHSPEFDPFHFEAQTFRRRTTQRFEKVFVPPARGPLGFVFGKRKEVERDLSLDPIRDLDLDPVFPAA